MRGAIWTALVSALLCAPVLAQENSKGVVDATFYGGELSDWTAPSAADSKALLGLSGPPARRMFDLLGAKAEIHTCVPDGEHIRARGDLSCTRAADGKFACAIGIDLKTGKSIHGSIC